MEIYLVKKSDGSFLPAYNSDHDKARKIKTGETLLYKYKRIRNLGHHRKFFALINLVFQNQEIYDNIDLLRKELTKAAGYYEEYVNHKGKKCYEAKSISFASMSQEDFEDLYQRFLDKVCEIFHFEEELINENIEQFY